MRVTAAVITCWLLLALPALAQGVEVEASRQLLDYGAVGAMLVLAITALVLVERRAHRDRKEHAAELKAEREARAVELATLNERVFSMLLEDMKTRTENTLALRAAQK